MRLTASGYRPDIDGLRSVAVLSVLLYHVGFQWIPGGFVGVDVFFVISGYLITGIIYREVAETRRFDFANFYVRRARRLLPALLFTCAFAFIAGFMVSSPDDFRHFGGSVFFALTGFSNFYFWSQSGYFEAASETMPLLHTWSLGVEEQFYYVWPALLTLLLLTGGGRWTFAALVGLCIASFAGNYWALEFPEGQSTIFFLTPFRIFELGIGAALVWLTYRPHRLVEEILLIVGLALIVWSALTFTSAIDFPAHNALVPCAGAALVIVAGRAHYTGLILRNRMAVGIGLISYSLYLIHWPLIVYFRQYTYADLTLVHQISLVTASLAAATFMYFYIETPIRFPRRGWRPAPTLVAAASAACIVALSIPATTVWANDGWLWRVPEERISRSSDEWLAQEERVCSNHNPRIKDDFFSCQNYRGKQKDIILWGDSHARHHVGGFSAIFPDYNIYAIWAGRCPAGSGFGRWIRMDQGNKRRAERCVRHNKRVLAHMKTLDPAIVILSSSSGLRRRASGLARGSREVLDTLREYGHTAMVLGDIVRPQRNLNTCAIAPFAISNEALAERCVGVPSAARREYRFSQDMQERLGPDYVSLSTIQCPDGWRGCQFFLDGRPIFRDTNHVTADGSTFLIGEASTAIHRIIVESNFASRTN